MKFTAGHLRGPRGAEGQVQQLARRQAVNWGCWECVYGSSVPGPTREVVVNLNAESQVSDFLKWGKRSTMDVQSAKMEVLPLGVA